MRTSRLILVVTLVLSLVQIPTAGAWDSNFGSRSDAGSFSSIEGLAVDELGNHYVSGWYWGAYAGSDYERGYHIFVMKLTPQGERVWITVTEIVASDKFSPGDKSSHNWTMALGTNLWFNGHVLSPDDGQVLLLSEDVGGSVIGSIGDKVFLWTSQGIQTRRMTDGVTVATLDIATAIDAEGEAVESATITGAVVSGQRLVVSAEFRNVFPYSTTDSAVFELRSNLSTTRSHVLRDVSLSDQLIVTANHIIVTDESWLQCGDCNAFDVNRQSGRIIRFQKDLLRTHVTCIDRGSGLVYSVEAHWTLDCPAGTYNPGGYEDGPSGSTAGVWQPLACCRVMVGRPDVDQFLVVRNNGAHRGEPDPESDPSDIGPLLPMVFRFSLVGDRWMPDIGFAPLGLSSEIGNMINAAAWAPDGTISVGGQLSRAASFTSGRTRSGARQRLYSSVAAGGLLARRAGRLPAKPTNITAIRSTDSTLIKWDRPAGHGSRITDYVIEISRDGYRWRIIKDGVSARLWTTIPTPEGGTVMVRVSAKTRIGVGMFSKHLTI